MTKTFLLPVLLLFAAMALVMLVVFGPATAPLKELPPATTSGAKADSSGAAAPSRSLPPAPAQTTAGAPSAPPQVAGGIPAAPTTDPVGAPWSEGVREIKLDEITEASNTFSAEGLKTLAPLLQDPDPEIREAAIEGIEQLAVPEGIEVLRRAAARARNERERRRLLEAAD